MPKTGERDGVSPWSFVGHVSYLPGLKVTGT